MAPPVLAHGLAAAHADRVPELARHHAQLERAVAVRPDFEETGPIGWAAAGEVAELADDLAALSAAQPAFAPELRAVSARLQAVSRRGDAVIGLIDYLSPEADGESRWFADLEGDA
jgi:hypothetical protein